MTCQGKLFAAPGIVIGMVLQDAGHNGTFRIWKDNPPQHSGQAGCLSKKS